ncbi:hypothetical protein BDN70DRAFT_398250 [Pholiota conissans]|uniref:Transmembrane protein n=1 Tax=Pholiota conissans TaxID=109636 RepID=A0A9P6CN99_9AGAR|nr:hypothetical protein BDN70DRAFT_398250 [Pholiota conissans]
MNHDLSNRTGTAILVSPELRISNPGITPDEGYAFTPSVTSAQAKTVLAPTTSSSTTLSSSTDAPTEPATPSATTTSAGQRYKILAIAISSTLGVILILILLLAGHALPRRRKSAISAAAQPFDSLPSDTSSTSSWPPLLRVPTEKFAAKFCSDAPSQAPVLPAPASVQEPVQPSQHLDVIAQLREYIRYLEGASVDDPPPEYPDPASGV